MASIKVVPTITGRGHTHDGRRVFTVASQSEANRWYIVVVNPHALSCDCKAGQYGKVCKHRMAVHERLVAERDAERAQAARLRDTAPLYRDNKPFSIFKS